MEIESGVDLEKLIHEDTVLTFQPECVRKKSNIGKVKKKYRFDSPHFSPKELLKDIPTHSPKLVALLEKIHELDNADRRNHGRVFKHFIYSDLKSSSAGAKLLASAMVAKGYHCGYKAPKLREPVEEEDDEDSDDENEDEDKFEEKKKKEKIWGKLELLSDAELEKTGGKNFYLLTSSGVYDQPISVNIKKQMLRKINQRPENIYGEDVRFMIMDSGFKEGIDLFDIRYIHIFEPSIVPSDQKQVIGRGTRTCGQKGLDFHPRRGWTLDVFIYDLEIPEKLRPSLQDSRTAMELYMKSLNLNIRMYRFAKEIEHVSIQSSVDYDLNKNIHSFSIEDADSESESINGGKRKLVVRNVSPIVVEHAEVVLPNGIVIGNQPEKRLDHADLKKQVQSAFGQFKWEKIKMENLCEEKGGAATKCAFSQLLKFNPTQNFVRNYFTPENPRKGMLLWHSVGTGKTSTAIATATTSFEKQGYTILWVTRSTLKSDIWKNMFDQVAHETIRDKIINENLVVPEDAKRRMRLLSKSWSIRPMSYKQFSNMILKQNSFYKSLTKKNGEVDPLHKTLLIIDEAHKLFGGDLSALEKPDMPVFQRALHNSYQVSGKNSVKLLLMTATPITQDSMELVQLINLCKLPDEQLPVDFDRFSDEFLNEEGEFSVPGKKKYMDSVAGHISYLNRENDARQFAQPVIHNIAVPIVNDIKKIEKFDKRVVRQLLDSDILELKKKVEENEEKITDEMKDINAKTFDSLYKKCDSSADCRKIVRSHIQNLVKEAKEEFNEIRGNIKELRENISEKNALKQRDLDKISSNMDNLQEEYDDYKDSLYFQLKNKCGKNIKTISLLNQRLGEHPGVARYDKSIEDYDARIKELYDLLKMNIDSYKKRIEQIKRVLKTDLNGLERSVVRMTLKDERKNMRVMVRDKTRETRKHVAEIQDKIKSIKTLRNQHYVKLRTTIKKQIQDNKKKEGEVKKAEAVLRKTVKRQEEMLENDPLKQLVKTHADEIDVEIKALAEQKKEREEQRIAEREKTAQEREKKAQTRKTEREKKAQEREKKAQTRKARRSLKKAVA